MTQLLRTQLADALVYMDALDTEKMPLAEEPKWGEALRLWLPSVIPLSPDYNGEAPVAWLVANDFGSYDLTTDDPTRKAAD
jgi:hypothetical protein